MEFGLGVSVFKGVRILLTILAVLKVTLVAVSCHK